LTEQNEVAQQIVEIMPHLFSKISADMRCAGVGMDPPHFRILAILADEPHNLSELAEHQGVSLATMSKTIATLTERNWVERDSKTSDRRIVQVELSPWVNKCWKICTACCAKNDRPAYRLIAVRTDSIKRRIRSTSEGFGGEPGKRLQSFHPKITCREETGKNPDRVHEGNSKDFSYLALLVDGPGCTDQLLLVNAANLYTPQLLRQLIDDGIYQLNMNVIWFVAGLIILVAIVRGVFNFLQGYLSEKTSQGVAYELRNEIFERLQHLSFSYHDQSQTGKLMTHMTSDVEMVRMFAGNGLLQLISAIVLLIGTLIILFSMNAMLTLIFLAMIPPIGLIFAVFIKKLLPRSRIVQEKLEKLNSILQENLAGIRVVKAFAREDYEKDRFFTRNQDLYEENITLLSIFATFFPMIFFVANVAIVGVLWAGGLEVIAGSMTLGELVAFIGYQGFFLMPIFMLGFVGSVISRAEASAQRIFEVVDAQSEVIDKPDAVDAPSFEGHVVFDQVSFRYIAGGEDPVIQKFLLKRSLTRLSQLWGALGLESHPLST
jgi:DNA-binding MarR family transcriptional regulator